MPFDAPAIDRRNFLTWSASGAFMLAVAPAMSQTAAQPGATPKLPWFKIGANGRVTMLSNAVDMGQGAQTGQAALLAEELDVPWDMVDVEYVDSAALYPTPLVTGGSRSISQNHKLIRLAGATAKSQLVAAAAAEWKISPSEVKASQGKLTNTKTGVVATYGQFAVAAAGMPTPTNVALKSGPDVLCGTPLPTLLQKPRTDGTMKYGIDTRLPGMLYATVKQAPVYGAKLASVDPAPALAVPGVKQVVKMEKAFGVIATSTWAAFKGAAALSPKWTEVADAANTPAVTQRLASTSEPVDIAMPEKGGADLQKTLREAYDKAAKKVEATYTLSPLSHAPLEPMNCTAQVKDGKVVVWAPTQVPTRSIDAAAAAGGVKADAVEMNVTAMGGGFGRRLQTDYVTFATLIAKEAGGAPVQTVWTREEDMTHDLYRTQVRQTYRAGLRPDGYLDGYEATSLATDQKVQRGTDPNPYTTIPSFVLNTGQVNTGVPVMAWRAVDPGMSTFGRESFINECAHAAGIDAVEYRMKLLGSNERAKRLLKAVAEDIGWKTKRPAGQGVGVAVCEAFGTLVAHAVEVEVKDDQLKVKRIVVATDPGKVIVPGPFTGQFQGGTLFALGAALGEGMTFTKGAADQQNFGDYKLLRHRQTPPVKVMIFESPDAALGGAGEPPVPTVAPALTAAIFQATGKRVRSLPISKQGFKV